MNLAKAQSALEYVMIVVLVLAVIVPAAYLFFRLSSESNTKIVYTQLDQIGRSIIDTAETVYYSGKGSKIIVEASIPENVFDAKILASRELVFTLNTETGPVETVFFSSPGIPLTSISASDGGCPIVGIVVECDLSELVGKGLAKIKIESIATPAGGTEVLIRRFN